MFCGRVLNPCGAIPTENAVVEAFNILNVVHGA